MTLISIFGHSYSFGLKIRIFEVQYVEYIYIWLCTLGSLFTR